MSEPAFIRGDDALANHCRGLISDVRGMARGYRSEIGGLRDAQVNYQSIEVWAALCQPQIAKCHRRASALEALADDWEKHGVPAGASKLIEAAKTA